jgi:protein-S-isoprenylcysteine O-methyltransferase Ste14
MTHEEAVRPASRPVHPALVGLALVAFGVVFGALLFWPAGRLDWTLAWVYLALLLVWVAVNWVLLSRRNPELIARRIRMGDGTKTWDKVWSGLNTPLMLAIWVVAGLDARDGASSLDPGVWPLGLLPFVAGSALLTWSMVVNPFFEKTVRIQTERGHRVIDTGPYAWVRHPGYLGFAGWLLGTPLLLASAWAFLPVAASLVSLVVRTALEDRTLRAELPGYAEYAARVRFRLIPGLW